MAQNVEYIHLEQEKNVEMNKDILILSEHFNSHGQRMDKFEETTINTMLVLVFNA